MQITTARRGRIVTTTGFTEYDHCLNPYVGCGHGCKYCYVRFFLKGDHPWGEWVRLRSHVETQLPRDLERIGPTRLVIGTMTDPYQPIEEEENLTRTALQVISQHHQTRVGLFTRSPLKDLDLLKEIGVVVHMTIAPIDPQYLKHLEPVTTEIEDRWQAVEALKKAGITTHINVAPALPVISDDLARPYCERMANAQIDEFFLDPMQLYKESKSHVLEALRPHPRFAEIHNPMEDKDKYNGWKGTMYEAWIDAWHSVCKKSPSTRALAMDHEHKVKIDINTGEKLPWKD